MRQADVVIKRNTERKGRDTQRQAERDRQMDRQAKREKEETQGDGLRQME